ncbi:hypothetical protein CapIbe_018438 [Capra ibex]
MGTSSGLGSGALGFLLHLGQLLSACLPSLLHGHWSECAGNWSVFLRCFCSGGTLTVFMVELCGRQSHFPLSCYNVLYHCAFYFTLFCLFASIIFTTNYVRFLPQSHTRNQAIAATAFCISTIINCTSRFQYTSATGDKDLTQIGLHTLHLLHYGSTQWVVHRGRGGALGAPGTEPKMSRERKGEHCAHPVDIPEEGALCVTCCCLRLPQLFSTCGASSLVTDTGVGKRAIGNWSLCIWGFCFAVTLVTSITELCKVQSRVPFFWNNFAVTYACYSALVCLSVSITYSVSYIQFLPRLSPRIDSRG